MKQPPIQNELWDTNPPPLKCPFCEKNVSKADGIVPNMRHYLECRKKYIKGGGNVKDKEPNPVMEYLPKIIYYTK